MPGRVPEQEIAMGVAEFPPKAATPRQKATGPETCYVLEGEVTVNIKGQPTRHFRKGNNLALHANVVHIPAAGTHRAKFLAMRVHVPGKQFYIPVPERFQKEE
jgi:quercetin dioxygenase-like cupin family protein